MMVMFIIALALLASLWLASRYAARHNRHMEYYERYSNDFYKYSKALIASDDTPKAILELMLFINRKMPNPYSGRQFIISVFFARASDAPDAAASHKHDEIAAFFKARPELAQSCERACYSALRAISYRSLVFGIIMRQLLLFDDKETHERPVQLALQLEKRMSHHNPGRIGGALGC